MKTIYESWEIAFIDLGNKKPVRVELGFTYGEGKFYLWKRCQTLMKSKFYYGKGLEIIK